MGGVDPTFAAVLERDRERYNALFLHARRTMRSLSPEEFKQYLKTCVEPTVIEAAKAASPDELQHIMEALYEVALDVVGNGLAGPGGRHPVLSRLWRELFPRVVNLWGATPRDAVAALSNGAINLSIESGVDAQAWLDSMLDFAPHTENLQELLELGQVLAWMGGMAHYRDGALQVATGMPARLQGALHIDPAALQTRWPLGDRPVLRAVAEVGNFHGLGGSFDSPPEVMQSGGQLYAFDNQSCWTIHADQFGATLKRYGTSLPDAPEEPGPFQVDGRNVTKAGDDSVFVARTKARSWACTDEFAAITTAHSHRIVLVALADA